MHVELGLSDDLIGIVELVRFGKMGDIAGMNHEGRLGRHRLHLGNGLAQRAERIGLAGLLKPIWLSLICRKVKSADSAAKASPSRPKDFGTPPDSVHNTPVPAQIIHSSAPLRLTPASSVFRLRSSLIIVSFAR